MTQAARTAEQISTYKTTGKIGTLAAHAEQSCRSAENLLHPYLLSELMN